MKLLICTIKDDLTGYKSLQLEDNEATALRNFTDAVNTNIGIKNHTNNYSLYKLGEYDTETGIITPELKLIVEAYSVIEKEVKA